MEKVTISRPRRAGTTALVEAIVARKVAAEEAAATTALGFVPCPGDHTEDLLLADAGCRSCGATL